MFSTVSTSIDSRYATFRRRAFVLLVGSTLLGGTVHAQSALGTPFIGRNHLSFYSGELTRSGGPELTRVPGIVYGRRFGDLTQAEGVSMVLRASGRPLGDATSGVLDLAATVGTSRAVPMVPGLTAAVSIGAGVMAWGDDSAKTGRLHVSVPVSTGLSYAVRIKGATVSPFGTASVARYDLRTSLDDVRQSTKRGWDGRYTAGVAVHFREVVLTSTRIYSEVGMPNRSRWAFSVGMSY